MQQYLINATAIWLISLLMFDLFLRRESYHSYNRFYLLFTFLLGALLPLWQWQGGSVITEGTFYIPVEKITAAKQTIIAASTLAGTVNWVLWVGFIYMAGMLFALTLLCIDVNRMATFYYKGKKSRQDGWTVIETGKGHAPFSFMNLLFVCSRQQYATDEWNIILEHEHRHKTLLHFADLLLVQVGRIVFWFHPLIYIYNKRLLLVHEYQADSAGSAQPKQYGSFLIEQALLSPAPNLSHSFNRSPIKKRILMLTRRSSVSAKFKMLAIVPLALASVVFFSCSKSNFSTRFDRNGNVVTYKGNKIELSEVPPPDTLILIDPVTGKEVQKIMMQDAKPLKLNNEKIFSEDEVNRTPFFLTGKGKLQEYIANSLKMVAKDLQDGEYELFMYNIVVDKKGVVTYYENHGMVRLEPDTSRFGGFTRTVLNTREIINAMDRMMDDMPAFSPATQNQLNVPCSISTLLRNEKIVVTNHELKIVDSK